MYNEFQQINSKETNNLVENEQKTRNFQIEEIWKYNY